MAKITESRIFEISKILATKAGKECQDGWVYVSSIAELVLRNLRNGLTFADNMDCEIKRITVRNNVETVVSVAASRKRASRVLIDRVVNTDYYVWDKFGFKYNSDGDLVIKIVFDGSPPATLDIAVDITILFG